MIALVIVAKGDPEHPALRDRGIDLERALAYAKSEVCLVQAGAASFALTFHKDIAEAEAAVASVVAMGEDVGEPVVLLAGGSSDSALH